MTDEPEMNPEELFAWFCDGGWRRLQAQGEIDPTFLIESQHGAYLLFAMPIWQPDMREQSYDIVRLMALSHNAVAVGMFCESWGISATPGAPYVSPSLSDQRREYAMAQMFMRVDDRCSGLFSQREILRAADGSISGFGAEQCDFKEEHVRSMLARTLPLDPVPRHERREAVRQLRKISVRVLEESELKR
jgi:hypothetical protein